MGTRTFIELMQDLAELTVKKAKAKAPRYYRNGIYIAKYCFETLDNWHTSPQGYLKIYSKDGELLTIIPFDNHDDYYGFCPTLIFYSKSWEQVKNKKEKLQIEYTFETFKERKREEEEKKKAEKRKTEQEKELTERSESCTGGNFVSVIIDILLLMAGLLIIFGAFALVKTIFFN